MITSTLFIVPPKIEPRRLVIIIKKSKVIKALILAIIVTSAQTLEPLNQDSGYEGSVFDKIVELLSNHSLARRNENQSGANRAKSLYNKLKHMKAMKKLLRDEEGEKKPDEDTKVDDAQAGLVESELKTALGERHAAILDHTYVEQKGKFDFLVMRPEIADPFVTVIPNNIYYDIEKKCANWLDDCTEKGIRAKLLRGVQSPYK